MTNTGNAEIAQLVEHNLAKVGVASSSLVFRSHQGRPSGRPFSLFPGSTGGEFQLKAKLVHCMIARKKN